MVQTRNLLVYTSFHHCSFIIRRIFIYWDTSLTEILHGIVQEIDKRSHKLYCKPAAPSNKYDTCISSCSLTHGSLPQNARSHPCNILIIWNIHAAAQTTRSITTTVQTDSIGYVTRNDRRHNFDTTSSGS